ncbi:ABC transporter ATP-binding protein [Klebsiella quasipneumoniae]|uniref:ABC transporter ATP-binding protein n=1 Tax=Klebsiella quasipneumoniae TaxID=1463165 RepID=UPI0038F80334
MGSKDSNYQVVYRYEPLPKYVPGGWLLFQRPKSCGGGFWLGKTYDGVFSLNLNAPFL